MSGSYLLPDYKPFQSSGGICYPSTDYRGVAGNMMQGGGSGVTYSPSNYSNNPGLIPPSNGRDFYEAPVFERKLDNKFMSDNMGVGYATAFGGAKKRKTKKRSSSRSSRKSTSSKKKTTKKTVKRTTSRKRTVSRRRRSLKGGQESAGATPMTPQFFDPKVPTPSYGADNGKGAMTAYGAANPQDVGVGLLAPYNTNPNGNQASMQKVGGGKKKRSTSRSSKKRSSSKSKKTKSKKSTKSKKTKRSSRSRSRSRK